MSFWSRITVVILVAGQALVVAVSLYQSVITIAGRIAARGPKAPAPLPSPPPRILALICARDEQDVIGRLIASLRAQQYPATAVDVLVVAHNCQDATPERARAAGARVIEVRSERPGKIEALAGSVTAWSEGWEYVVILDADSRIETNFLSELACHLEGQTCIQVETVPHVAAGTVAESYGLGRRARNALWWRPREALGLGTTINGSGFAIRTDVLRAELSSLRTVTEDLQLTARLASQGHPVRYLSTTHVWVEEPHELGSSMRQRTRWARGHLRVVALEWPALGGRALRGDWAALDMAIYLAVPTRLLTRIGVSLSFAIAVLRLPFALPVSLLALALSGEWALPVIVGLRDRLLPPNLSGLRLAFENGVLSLLWFPIGLWALLTARSTTWHRMPRAAEEETDATAAA